MKENKPDHLETAYKIGSILLAIVAIFGAALPIAGFSFSLGYLSNFGIDANTFPQSVGDLWQDSFMMAALWLSPLITLMGKMFLPAVIIYFAVISILAALTMTGKIPLSKETYQIYFGTQDRIFEAFKSVHLEFRSFTYTGVVLISTLLATAFFLTHPYLKGKEYAQKSLDRHIESGCTSEKWSSCVDYSNPNNPLAKSYSGLLVSASSTHIAIFDGKNLSIIPRNSEYILTISYKKFDEQSEQMNSEAQNE